MTTVSSFLPPAPAFEWRLQVLMAHRHVRFATDLHKLLVEHGYTFGVSTVTSWVRRQPERLDLDHLAALCHVLHCTPNDLLGVSTTALSA